ncbi:MerR family transcriptional regulator [Paenibacillus kribbensis]|uniref:MerR family transcriptional regulator n=1 Tax=Paenibacillus kribbensis TaxID=172713 RepID=A0A222WGP2_9BACL|nr:MULTISPECIES: MerR family transcriptional regulator [Paenibacillus]ASR45507.1 MerR family transcriptional regulator [Paenibacillus kribbensis]EHS55171.1 transcriptional regulator [Paenibacillus sp. Aloe-11]MEC0238157.1 MerR family transcriptional regulator [Paenibacillus kribbensis]
MGYTIGEVANKMGVSAYTLRFYDKEGLLPFVDRNKSGNRDFKESDFEWLAVITCLKNSGMPVKKIRQFIDMSMEGDATLRQRLEVFENHKKTVNDKISELNKYMEKIDYKIWYYQTAIDAGSEAIHSQQPCKLVED